MLVHLQQLDGSHVAAAILAVAIALIVLPGLIVRLGATETDAEARTRAASSSRKAGRTAVTR